MRFVEPAKVVEHFHIREGDTVADFGAGSGFFAEVLAQRAVGGKVVAFEIQKNLLEKISEVARTKGLSNLQVVWCDLEAPGGTKQQDGVFDVGVLINTLFQIQNKPVALTEIARVMRTGSKLFIVDWTESFGGMGPQSGDVLSEEQARTLAEQHGFSYERSFPAGEHHYGLAFRKG